VLAGLAAFLLVGGAPGAVLAVALVLAGPPLLSRLESSAHRRERLALVAAAPLVADLLAASLAAGATLDRALPVIARAVGGPAGKALDQVASHVRLGEPVDRAWQRAVDLPGLGAIAGTVARATRSGAPLAGMLAVAADDLRAEAAAASLAEVRATSVRAVLPLGLCLLPAFALLGIVPVVAGLIPAL
jgi:Flp pilus assembly protein TadB